MPTIGKPAASSFDLLAQRSEQVRVRLVIGVLVALAVLAVLRRLAGGVTMNSPVFWWTLGLLGLGVAYESWMLLASRRAIAADRVIAEWRWRLNAAIEVLIAVGLLVILHLLSPRGEVAALSAPALLVLPMVVLLSVLRLRPAFTLWTGLAGAGAHAVLAVRAFAVSGAEESALPVYLSYSVLLAITGVAGAVVARRVRGYVEAAVREEAERKRVQMLARNTLIFGLAKLAEFRDTDTGSHLERISVYCGLLARQMAPSRAFIDDDWVQTLSVASSMHDIGKVGIPDAVLCKPGRLTDDERHVIQRHPGLGHSVLAEVLARNGGDVLLQMSDQIAACHHERWDGAGYPSGLAGEAIPLPARIVAVADVYDALTSPRVYKPAMSHAEASGIIGQGSGTQFDPAVVAAFNAAAGEFDDARGRMAGGGHR
ncbi:MAG: HD-GYP domain-containing protein [bacterium]